MTIWLGSRGLWLRDITIFLAWVGGLVLTLLSISSAALTVWRLGADPGWTSPFFIKDGLFSRYPAWIVLTVATQAGAFFLKRWVSRQVPAARKAPTADMLSPCVSAAGAATATV